MLEVLERPYSKRQFGKPWSQPSGIPISNLGRWKFPQQGITNHLANHDDGGPGWARIMENRILRNNFSSKSKPSKLNSCATKKHPSFFHEIFGWTFPLSFSPSGMYEAACPQPEHLNHKSLMVPILIEDGRFLVAPDLSPFRGLLGPGNSPELSKDGTKSHGGGWKWCFFSFWGDFQVPCSEESEMILYTRVHISNICPYIVDLYVQCRLINIPVTWILWGITGWFPHKILGKGMQRVKGFRWCLFWR